MSSLNTIDVLVLLAAGAATLSLVFGVLAWRAARLAAALATVGAEQVASHGPVLAAVEERLSRLLRDVGAQSEERLTRLFREESALLRREAAAHALEGREESSRGGERLREAVERMRGEMSAVVQDQLQKLSKENSSRLEEMRLTVAEKLEGTLERRLGESFKLVSDRLELVHKGLGEMQTLAVGVGDLKKVLSNVKTRGTWGEIQLGVLLEQLLAPEQYAMNVETVKGRNQRVEFALRLPGSGERPVWLPIDAKFPLEAYERLVAAQEASDAALAEAEGQRLEQFLKISAKDIAEKYLGPPETTDFAILYLPTEGLFAEVVRRPGLTDQLQREHRVTVAGPTTLTALLNSLQMGFRTLAIQKRSGEVWGVLGAVKTEFTKFGDILAKVEKKLLEAGNVIESAHQRTRVIARRLRDVEELPPDGELFTRAGAIAGGEEDL